MLVVRQACSGSSEEDSAAQLQATELALGRQSMALLAANDTIAALEEEKEELLKENQLLKEEKEQLKAANKQLSKWYNAQLSAFTARSAADAVPSDSDLGGDPLDDS